MPLGTTFSLVGESGCGKSTVARLVVGLHRPSGGRVLFDGCDMAAVTARADTARLRKRLQMIFQDPYASLNPRWRVAHIVAEPLRAHRLLADRPALPPRLGALLQPVGVRTEAPRVGKGCGSKG